MLAFTTYASTDMPDASISFSSVPFNTYTITRWHIKPFQASGLRLSPFAAKMYSARITSTVSTVNTQFPPTAFSTSTSADTLTDICHIQLQVFHPSQKIKCRNLVIGDFWNATWLIRVCNWLSYFCSFAVLGLAANAGLTPGRDESPAPDQRETPPLNPQRSLAHALANHTVPPRAKSLTQTLVSPAPRVDPESKRSMNPEVVPRRNLPVRSLEAARGPVQRVVTRNIPQNFPPSRTVSSPSPQRSALPPAPGLALDPDRPPKTDRFCNNVQNLIMVGNIPGPCLRCLQIKKDFYRLELIGTSWNLYFHGNWDCCNSLCNNTSLVSQWKCKLILIHNLHVLW